jgi:hypothetical protein
MLEDRVTHRERARIDRECREGLLAETADAVRVRVIADRRLLNPAEDVVEVEFGGRFVCH